MKDTSTLLHLPELKATFSERVSIAKNELRNFYRIRTQDFNEQIFRRVLYALEKEQILVPLNEYN
jgi:aminoglycoside N3'-acetyltransferase